MLSGTSVLGGSGRVTGKQTSESRVSEALPSFLVGKKFLEKQNFYTAIVLSRSYPSPPPPDPWCTRENVFAGISRRFDEHNAAPPGPPVYTCAALTYILSVTTWNAGNRLLFVHTITAILFFILLDDGRAQ